MPYRQKIILVYAAIMLVAALLSGFIYVNDQRLQSTSDELFDTTLPLLRDINALRNAKVEHERLLYEYYATTDQERLKPAIQTQQNTMRKYLDQLEGLPMQTAIQATFRRIKDSANHLDHNLMQTHVNWDLAREDLIKLSSAGRELDPYLDNIIDSVEQRARMDSTNSRDQVKLGTQLVISFCVAIITLALFVGYFVDRYIRESAERKRLAMFAERNPNPVLSANINGDITYINPAAQAIIHELGLNNGKALLPTHTAQLWHKGQPQYSGTLAVADRIFDYSLSLLSDLQLAHIHLKDITEQRRAEQALEHQAKYDLLTQLPNRHQLEQKLTSHTQNREHSFHLIIINLHRFERITASYGYQFGDKLLSMASERLQEQLNPNELLAPGLCRMGGTNFAFMLPNHDPLNHQGEAINDLLQQLIASMEEPLRLNDNEFYLSLCIGTSCFPNDSFEVNELLKCADAALMQSRKSEGNSFHFYDQALEDHNTHQLTIEAELRQAIANHELELFYQPKLDTRSGKVKSCESLMRWMVDGKPKYSPAEFIPIAEQSGLIIQMGEWALTTAFAQAQQWREQFPVSIAVNLSQRQFQHHDFLPLLMRLKLQYPGIEKWIELEITESLLMQEVHTSIEIMRAIKAMGFTLSIDDFGTGYSSLSYLKDFPIDKLKVDRSFIIDMCSNREDEMLVKTVIQLAHSLGLTTVAEGVETTDQLSRLQDLECEEIQGYLISKPIPAQQFQVFYEQHAQGNLNTAGISSLQATPKTH